MVGCKKMCPVHMVALVLVLVGALNWGLVGLFGFNLVNYLLGSWPTAERVVYVLVGLSAILKFFGCHCKKCMEACSKEGGSCCGGEKKM